MATYNLAVPRDALTVTSGQPKTSKFQQEIGLEVFYKFCPDCGTTIFKGSPAEMFKAVYLVQAGTVDTWGFSKADKPDAELWTARKFEWVVPTPGLAQKEQF